MSNWKIGDIVVLDNGALARCLDGERPGLWQVGSPYSSVSITNWIDQHHPVRLVREGEERDKIGDGIQALGEGHQGLMMGVWTIGLMVKAGQWTN